MGALRHEVATPLMTNGMAWNWNNVCYGDMYTQPTLSEWRVYMECVSQSLFTIGREIVKVVPSPSVLATLMLP
ncbi:MAG: hypothetical protein NVS4B8_01260 [Herpetosiphon sp.]